MLGDGSESGGSSANGYALSVEWACGQDCVNGAQVVFRSAFPSRFLTPASHTNRNIQQSEQEIKA